MKNYLKILIISLILIIPINVFAINNSYVDETAKIVGLTPSEDKIDLYFFYSKTCPHCKAEEEWFESTLLKKYGEQIKIHSFETTEIQENRKKLDSVEKHYDINNNGVPILFIGSQHVIGWSSERLTGDTIISIIEGYLNEHNNIKLVRYYNGIVYYEEDGEPKELSEEKFQYEYNDIYTKIKNEYKFDKDGNYIEAVEKILPVLGKINVRDASLPIIAIVLGFIDGFNPCAMWILLFLISMLLGTKNKKRMWILGLTFLFVSGAVYFLSMLGISIVLKYLTTYLKIIIGAVAVIIGIYNLKKYYDEKTKKVSCTVVDDKKRKTIMDKIKKFTTEKSFFLALLGVTGLAISVNMIELACSLGLPTVFSEILVVNNISTVPKLLYMLLYIIFYMIDDVIVFVISMITLETTGITNKYQKLVHLVGGLLMILMGLLLIFKPEWLMLNF